MPDFTYEKQACPCGRIYGIDEAGRGPWCGPVVAACVCFPNFVIDPILAREINDSKKLSAQKREKLFPLILSSGAYVGIGQASAQEIDKMNILQATFLAMHRALESVPAQARPDFALIDGNRLPQWDLPCQCLIKGDALSLSIAAASIVAKVTRDHLMQELAKEYPDYGWDKNAGYGTKVHLEAMKKYGLTPYHRKSYRPVQEFLTSSDIR